MPAKQYTYILSERDDQKDGYEYSNATYRVEVSIADTKDNGELDVTMTVKDAEGNPLGEDENPSYTNFYEAKGSLALTAKKNVIGKTRQEKPLLLLCWMKTVCMKLMKTVKFCLLQIRRHRKQLQLPEQPERLPSLKLLM